MQTKYIQYEESPSTNKALKILIASWVALKPTLQLTVQFMHTKYLVAIASYNELDSGFLLVWKGRGILSDHQGSQGLYWQELW